MAKRPTTLKIVGGLIKTLIYSMIALMVSFLMWRIFFSTIIPKSVDKLIVNEKLADSYAEYGDNLYMFTQDQSSITRADENYGYFSVADFVIIPEAQQVQVVFRYNNSTIEHLVEDFGLAQIPDRSDDLFDLSLSMTIDLTPDDSSDNTNKDNIKEVRYFPSEIITETTFIYNYRRVVFDGVSIDDIDIIGLFFDIYYTGNVNYEEEAYGTLCVYDNQMKKITVPLSSTDKKALKEAIE